VKIMVLGIRGVPNVQGGVETHAEQLYPRLAALGCDVEVLVRTPFVPRGTRYFGAVRLRRLWSPVRPGFEALVHSCIGVLYAGIVRPDLLHIHSIGPAIVTPLARLFGLKVVVTYHSQNYQHEKWGALARLLFRAGERFGMRWSHARIAISRSIAELILSRFHVRAELIPNGVVVPVLRRETGELQALGLAAGRYIMQVGRISAEKRQLDLIAAFAQARPPEWQLVLVGGLDASSYSQQVQARALEAGVVLAGFRRGAALQQLYTHAGLFVLPSAHEGLPIALLEALSFGLPVLASDIAANLELDLSHDSYFRMGDVDDLAAALRRTVALAQNFEQRQRRMAWVMATYDWDRVAEQTLQVYRAVLDLKN
jgi:glycosyltransferase involved in cell wall biosynthesis